MAKFLGSLPSQVSTNGDLGSMSQQDSESVNITGGNIVLSTDTMANPYQDTSISTNRPSLSFDFCNGIGLDPRITFTRASTATYYDAKTSALAEQNLITYSQDFTQTQWIKSNASVISNTTISPDGTLTASKIFENTANSAHGIYQVTSITTGSTYTTSFYAKAAERTWIVLGGASNTSASAWFDLSNGVVGTISPFTASITPVGNGWYRCSITFTSLNTGINNQWIYTSTANNVLSYTGDGFSGVYVWGAQNEIRSANTAYTTTTTAAITNYIPQIMTAANNSPRFDYDPITGECKGFLLEESRTNLYPSNHTQGLNTTALTVYTNRIVGPNGTISAANLVPNTSSGVHNANFGTNLGSGTFTFSVYVKYNGYPRVGLRVYDGIAYQIRVTFDLLLGSVALLESGTATITPIGNGWYRCTATGTSPSGAMGTVAGWVIEPLPGGLSVQTNYTGDGYSGLYIWGIQIELGAFATSYIPTSGSQVTRATEQAIIPAVTWYNNDQGSFYAEYNSLNPNPSNLTVAILGLYAASIGNCMPMYTGIGQNTQIYNNLIGASGTAIYSLGSSLKGATTYSSTGLTACLNGGVVGKNSGNQGTFAFGLNGTLYIGRDFQSSYNYFSGRFKRISYYPKRLDDVELIEMTSI